MGVISDSIMTFPVWDTHTHLDTSENVAARDVWDILHYFWFARELRAAGYPEDAESIPEKRRIEYFLDAFAKSKNTYWNRIVRIVLKDLFDAEIRTASDVAALNERLAETSTNPSWPSAVCGKIGIRRIVVGTDAMDTSPAFGALVTVVPHYHFSMADGYSDMVESAGSAEGIGEQVRANIDNLTRRGYTVVRSDLEPFVGALRGTDADEYLGHAMLDAFNQHGTRLQIFTGMKRDWKIDTMLNDPGRIVNLYPLFDQYENITFELINAADGNNFDILQAARVFPNVCPGGLWWFNFRASTYRAVFQHRFEALPSSRSCVVASDARCIEWAYGKVLLVKKLLGEFLDRQIDDGWTDIETAELTAANWLYGTAAAGYGE